MSLSIFTQYASKLKCTEEKSRAFHDAIQLAHNFNTPFHNWIHTKDMMENLGALVHLNQLATTLEFDLILSMFLACYGFGLQFTTDLTSYVKKWPKKTLQHLQAKKLRDIVEEVDLFELLPASQGEKIVANACKIMVDFSMEGNDLAILRMAIRQYPQMIQMDKFLLAQFLVYNAYFQTYYERTNDKETRLWLERWIEENQSDWKALDRYYEQVWNFWFLEMQRLLPYHITQERLKATKVIITEEIVKQELN
jgi:hypothetical protein